jgi:hypothetical protein
MSTATQIKPDIQIGRRVYCVLYGGRNGIIVCIHGTPDAGSVRQIGGGVVMAGGSASVDVVWDDGTESRRVPEAIVHSCQWRLLAEVATSAEIMEARRLAAETVARNRAEAEAARLKLAADTAALIAENPHLAPVTQATRYSLTHTAKNIRADLKAHFPGVKFSVRCDHSSVRLGWSFGPTVDDVKAVVGAYKAGYFDGMTDMYEFTKSAWTEAFGRAQYISYSRGA